MCWQPFQKKDGTVVPCGKCPKCKKRNVSGWSHRLRMQEKICTSSYFLTLTYNNDNLPFSQNGFPVLCKKHLQDYFKRLRESHTRYYNRQMVSGVESIKYFAVGEYGGKSKRPHYHIIIFNVELEAMLSANDVKGLYWTDYDGKLPVVDKNWPWGHVTVGKVSGASIGYTLKYMHKRSAVGYHMNDDRVPEFRLMSKGLGKNYVTPSIINYHKADLVGRLCITLEDGSVIAMPRYYRKFIYQNLTIDQINEMKQYWKDRLEDDIWKAHASGKKLKTVREHLAAVEAAAAALDKRADHGRTI